MSPGPAFHLEYVLALRLHHHLTQQTVADALGIDQSVYSRLEQGKIRFTHDYLTKLAGLFGVDPGVFWQDGGLTLEVPPRCGAALLALACTAVLSVL